MKLSGFNQSHWMSLSASSEKEPAGKDRDWQPLFKIRATPFCRNRNGPTPHPSTYDTAWKNINSIAQIPRHCKCRSANRAAMTDSSLPETTHLPFIDLGSPSSSELESVVSRHSTRSNCLKMPA